MHAEVVLCRGPGRSDGFGPSSQMDLQLQIWIGSSLCIGSADDRMDSADSTIE